MPRAPNFSYQNPAEEITSSLVRAIVGDPALAAKARTAQSEAQLREAHRQEALAHSSLYASQTTGQDGQNAASASLPAMFANMAPWSGSDPAIPQPSPEEAFRAGLPALMAAMAQQQGDKVRPGETIGTLASFLGGDEMARRGLAAQGHSPTEDFAITPQRADTIAANGFAADQSKAFGVAERNHATDVPVANIRRRSAFDVATVNNRDDVPVARIAAQSRTDVAGIKSGGAAPGFDAITAALPGATMNSGLRTPEHNREVGGVPNSLHLGQRSGIQAYDIPAQPGMTVEQAAARIEQASGGRVRVVEMRDERGRVGLGGQKLGGWHFALQAVGGTAPPKAGGPAKASGPAKAAKALTTPQVKMVDAELTTYFSDRGVPLTGDARDIMRTRALEAFRRSGNPVAAVQEAVRSSAQERRARTAARAPAPQAGPPVQGARRAPDGNWYVQTGRGADGSPAYSRVD